MFHARSSTGWVAQFNPQTFPGNFRCCGKTSCGRRGHRQFADPRIQTGEGRRGEVENEAAEEAAEAACFLGGTRVRTPDGEIAIEDLEIGDLVETLNGPLPVKWIGRQTFRKTTSCWHPSVAPIRVARFALDDQYPRRDLYLSPQHCVFVDGVLIAVEHLVNGTSVAPAKMDDRDVIEYFHVELVTHEVIFAEGAPAETLWLTNGREHFANFVEYERLYGSDKRPVMKPFAPAYRYYGGRAHLQGLFRLAVSPIVDVRDPVERARVRIAARAEVVGV